MQLPWWKPYVHPRGLTWQVFLFVRGDTGWCWRYISGTLTVKWRVLYFIFFFWSFHPWPAIWTNSQGSCMSQRDRTRKSRCAREMRHHWASFTRKSFLVHDGPKPDKSYSPWPDLCIIWKISAESWGKLDRLLLAHLGQVAYWIKFPTDQQLHPGWVQRWWSERVEKVQDLILTVRCPGLFRGNVNGVKQVVVEPPNPEGSRICMCGKILERWEMSKRNCTCQRRVGDLACRCVTSVLPVLSWDVLPSLPLGWAVHHPVALVFSSSVPFLNIISLAVIVLFPVTLPVK